MLIVTDNQGAAAAQPLQLDDQTEEEPDFDIPFAGRRMRWKMLFI